jgi:G3E family GTPase
LLQHILHNKEGLRIAVIVNDVASVNIDSKLVAGSQSGATASGMVELQNGCACCSLSEELMTSVSELVTLSELRPEDEAFDHIVIELSGVASPKSVRAQFQEAVLYDMPLMEKVRLDTMVTVVDCSIFLNHLKSSKMASVDEMPELFYRDGEEPAPNEDWMEGIPPLLLEALVAGGVKDQPPNPVETYTGVAELLVEQTETADVVLLNKMDITDDRTSMQIENIVNALNPRATVIRTKFGAVNLEDVLAIAGGQGVAEAGIVDDHKDAIEAALRSEVGLDQAQICTEPACTDSTHDHSHAAATHDHEHSANCAEPACTDPTHDHSHAPDCADPVCTDPTHDHSHSPDCADPVCTDPTHDHSHSQDHAGIGSYVYKARRPFHPSRLASFLRNLPATRGLPELDEGAAPMQMPERTKAALNNVLRSKGFTWSASSNDAALYWSHAGSSFEMQCLGRWWATLPRDQWPVEAVSSLLEDFDDPNHEDGNAESASVGDRRQELVFIGPRLGDREKQECIFDALNLCLLTDGEWSEYQRKKTDEAGLRAAFANTINARVVSY